MLGKSIGSGTVSIVLLSHSPDFAELRVTSGTSVFKALIDDKTLRTRGAGLSGESRAKGIICPVCSFRMQLFRNGNGFRERCSTAARALANAVNITGGSQRCGQCHLPRPSNRRLCRFQQSAVLYLLLRGHRNNWVGSGSRVPQLLRGQQVLSAAIARAPLGSVCHVSKVRHPSPRAPLEELVPRVQGEAHLLLNKL